MDGRIKRSILFSLSTCKTVSADRHEKVSVVRENCFLAKLIEFLSSGQWFPGNQRRRILRWSVFILARNLPLVHVRITLLGNIIHRISLDQVVGGSTAARYCLILISKKSKSGKNDPSLIWYKHCHLKLRLQLIDSSSYVNFEWDLHFLSTACLSFWHRKLK